MNEEEQAPRGEVVNWPTVGENIKKERVAAGWKKQFEFEKACGLGPSIICHIEKGTRRGSTETIVRICIVLGVRPDRLLGLPAVAVPAGYPSNGKGESWRDAIGYHVRYCRERGKLTRGELAALTGLSSWTIKQVESGHRFPSVEALAALCIHLKVPAWWLLGFPSFV